jgi:response regulator RpfG family c-di-GMP phosphodiesterase
LKPHILALLELDENSAQVVESLKSIDRRTTVCKKFTQAIELLEEKSCALIISDVHLENGGNVFDFLRWAKANPMTKDTPFVLLSCKPTKMAKYVEDGVRTTARLLGADLFLTFESFDPVSFRNQIEPLLLIDSRKQKATRKTVGANSNNQQSNDHKEKE